jgi:hypothetical protein
MTTLHIENTVLDFDDWLTAFDKYERFRTDRGVRAYRVSRSIAEPNRVTVDLDFDSIEAAETFRGGLEQIWSTPHSKELLVEHGTPLLLDVVVQRTL